MMILVDMTTVYEYNIHGSINSYIIRFLKGVPFENRSHFKLLVPLQSVDLIKNLLPDYLIEKFGSENFFVEFFRRVCTMSMSLFYEYKVNHSGCDVLFIANDLVPYTRVKTKLRKVVVIHDLKCIKNKYPLGPKSFTRANFLFYEKFLLSADTIIAISNYTKKDILDNFEKVKSKNIQVVYNSICLSNIEAAPEMLDVIGEKYILYVNTLQKYKNIETLLYAFAMIKDNISNNLVVVGKATEYWNKEMVPLLEKLGLTSRVIQIQNLSDAELKYVYTHASLFVTTSLHEGFGYSPIEAACCNIPVISSKCEALYETTCGLVDYYEPELDYNNLAHTMLHVILNPPEKNKLLYISNFFKNKYSSIDYVNSLMDLLISA